MAFVTRWTRNYGADFLLGFAKASRLGIHIYPYIVGKEKKKW
jgi:hypothetical protein